MGETNGGINTSSSEYDDAEDDSIISEEVCVTCQQEIGEDDQGICCDNCFKWKHDKCFGDEDNFDAASKQIVWFCSKKCEENIPEYTQVSSIISSKKVSNANLLDFMRIIFMQNKKTQQVLKTNKKNDKIFKEKIKSLENTNKKLTHDVSQLQQEIVKLKQDKLKNKAICFGFMDSSSSLKTNSSTSINSQVIIQEIKSYAQRLEFDIPRVDHIKHCYNIHSKSTKKTCTVLEFDSDFDKNQFVYGMKKIKRANNQIKVSAFEMLTVEIRQLLTEAREALSTDYPIIWTKNGRIWIRKEKEKGSTVRFQAIEIKSTKDIIQLINQKNSKDLPHSSNIPSS